MEQTLVLIKPDGVRRQLVGEIISRFERAGLKIKALKLVRPSKSLLEKHYPTTEKWFRSVGEKVLKLYEEKKIDPQKELGTFDPSEIGRLVKSWLVSGYMSSGPVVALVLSGYHAVDNARKICGYTYPYNADMGTIRGDFSLDSPIYANLEKRAVENLIHASESLEEAHREIKLWFREEEIIED